MYVCIYTQCLMFISPCVADPSYHHDDHQLILGKARPSSSPDTAGGFQRFGFSSQGGQWG